MFEYLIPNTIGIISSELQVAVAIVLIGVTLVYQEKVFKKEGKIFGHYPWSIRVFFAPVYEEIIFRGVIFFPILTILSPALVIIVTSILFGFWHFKNYKYHSLKSLFLQVVYAGFFIGPVLGIITLVTGNIWTAIIFHSLNNLLVPILNRCFSRK